MAPAAHGAAQLLASSSTRVSSRTTCCLMRECWARLSLTGWVPCRLNSGHRAFSKEPLRFRGAAQLRYLRPDPSTTRSSARHDQRKWRTSELHCSWLDGAAGSVYCRRCALPTNSCSLDAACPWEWTTGSLKSALAWRSDR